LRRVKENYGLGNVSGIVPAESRATQYAQRYRRTVVANRPIVGKVNQDICRPFIYEERVDFPFWKIVYLKPQLGFVPNLNSLHEDVTCQRGSGWDANINRSACPTHSESRHPIRRFRQSDRTRKRQDCQRNYEV